VFLKVMPHSGNIGGHFHAIRQPHTSNLTKRRIRLLGGLRINADANSPLLGTTFKSRTGSLIPCRLPSETNHLTERRHSKTFQRSHLAPNFRGSCRALI
jgi:hypothetical protein